MWFASDPGRTAARRWDLRNGFPGELRVASEDIWPPSQWMSQWSQWISHTHTARYQLLTPPEVNWTSQPNPLGTGKSWSHCNVPGLHSTLSLHSSSDCHVLFDMNEFVSRPHEAWSLLFESTVNKPGWFLPISSKSSLIPRFSAFNPPTARAAGYQSHNGGSSHKSHSSRCKLQPLACMWQAL